MKNVPRGNVTLVLYLARRQNRKLRDSSNESDDELEQFEQPPASPPPRSIIDDTKNVLPSRIKAAAAAVSQVVRILRGLLSADLH